MECFAHGLWWLLGISVLKEAFEPQRAARTTRRIVSCETPESSATLRRDAFFSSTRFYTVGHLEEGILFAGFLGPGCMASHHRDPISSHRHLMTEPASQQPGGYGHDEGKQKS